MELNKKQVQFWTAILVLCLIVSVAVMLVDFSIKTSILEESNKLRLFIEEHRGQGSGTQGNSNDPHNITTIPGSVLVDESTGMETGHGNNGDKATGPTPKTTRPKSRGQASSRTIQDGNE